MTWDEIKQEVEAHGGVRTMAVDTLREAHGAGKMGVHIRGQISSQLAGMGLGHVPRELPNYSHDTVRIYKRGTPAGNLIEAVLETGEGNDRKIVEQTSVSGQDFAEVVRQIRELVAE